MERLYSTTKAGELIGGISADDVLRLGRAGKLKLVPQVVRGKGVKPRLYVKASEIDRYIASLSAATETEIRPAKASRAKTGLRKELAEATRYF